jgi:hypothetical protein
MRKRRPSLGLQNEAECSPVSFGRPIGVAFIDENGSGRRGAGCESGEPKENRRRVYRRERWFIGRQTKEAGAQKKAEPAKKGYRLQQRSLRNPC